MAKTPAVKLDIYVQFTRGGQVSTENRNPKAHGRPSVGFPRYARSNSKVSPTSTPTNSRADSFSTAAPSPATSVLPFNVTEPVATCTQAARPGDKRVRHLLPRAEGRRVKARVGVEAHRPVAAVGEATSLSRPFRSAAGKLFCS